ncbi:MAG: hypothetical protein ABIG10_02475 [bacterium]
MISLSQKLNCIIKKGNKMKVEVIISISEFKLSFSREMELHVVFSGHKIGYSGIGMLTIYDTMDSHIDNNGKSCKLTAFVSMNDDVKESFIKKGKEAMIKRFNVYGFEHG